MRHASPLRYPGGKAAMTSVLRQIRRLNGLGGSPTVEPYAGGAGASLKLLYLEETDSVHINDGDPAIHDFWWAAVHRSDALVQKLIQTPVCVEEWRRQRAIFRSGKRVSRLARGFAAFYLNRCNRSGIIRNGSVIGGLEQGGKWKLDARFNKPSLRQRFEKIAEYQSRIEVSGIDGIELIESLDPYSVFLFVDPPYFQKGRTLYMNSLDHGYHAQLATSLRSMSQAAWVLTYDDCPEIRDMYAEWASVRPFSLRYSASASREGSELLITPRWMELPEFQSSGAIGW